ncbi:Gp19/Gp15/Gp42 family protein [Rathayibacter sp. AY2B9]|uniref:Gp19/Gp15/Gp42 family protein n=1 Tax=Rathayibacter sp. AY2B9 TaxID=2080572 RepID=UPI000CE88E57|nr:Gp19/Gp15/Gp42 family protein [Rathayibacter sp. AY2B9]PPG34520.1 hypothetical protein C5C25_00420 [Rathayibacter sp. AY2B9]
MVYATAEDVQAIWPGFPAGQEARAAALLEDAAVRIDAYAPPVAPLTPADAAVRRTVSREMVVYVMMTDANVDPVTQKSRSMGPFSESWSFDRPGRTLMLTDEHKRMLRPRVQEAFTVSMVDYRPTDDPLWWSE